jgi:hypothetical protein
MILVCSAFLFFLASMKSNDFPFCHPEIASILAAPVYAENDIQSHIFLNETAMSIKFPVSSSMNDLVTLAVESDEYVFRSKQHGIHCQDLFMNELVAFCSSSNESSAATTATALLALNALESSIRYSTGFTSGRAPLVKKMIERISDEHIGRACQLLLLPQGLNLRNLVWYEIDLCFTILLLRSIVSHTVLTGFVTGMVLYLSFRDPGWLWFLF